MAKKERAAKESGSFIGRYRRQIDLTSGEQGVEQIKQLSRYGDDRLLAAQAALSGPEPFLEFAVSRLHGGPGALDQYGFHIGISVQRFAGFDLACALLVARRKTCPFAQLFRRREWLLRFGTDFGKDFHSIAESKLMPGILVAI